jgi:hypothetical protein
MNIFSLVTLAVAFLAQGAPSQRTITLNGQTGHDRVTFNPVRTPEVEVRRWIRLSPQDVNVGGDYSVPESLEGCVKQEDPEYLDCGTRDWKAKNFVFNANVNLRRIRDRIKTLDESSYPPELKAVVSHFKRIQETQLFFESQRLAFIQNGQISGLSASFGGIDPGIQCSAEIAKVASATDKDRSYHAVKYDWGNCVIRAFRDKIGAYPVSAWNKFLIQYGIKERYVYDPVD